MNVTIEVPAHSSPVKYESDKESGSLVVDRFISTPMFYPCNYGYLENTMTGDGDPLDVLVVTPYPLMSGCVINSRPVGVLFMEDEAGRDCKILAVADNSLCKDYDDINDIEDVSDSLKDQIVHFFNHYKDLEDTKWVNIEGWGNTTDALSEINKARGE